jgi:hypothetical protein
MPKVKLHYTFEGSTSVLATISANIATLDFIFRGLPGQPANYKPLRLETADGSPLTDLHLPPPDTVYVIGTSV